MGKLLTKKNIAIFYYLLLLCISVFWSSETEPPTIVRYGYLAAFFIPLMVRYQQYFPACLICFMAISTNGYAFGFFPYAGYMYFIITLFGVFFIQHNKKPNIPSCAIFFLIYTFIVNITTSDNPQNIFYSSIVALLFSFYTAQDTMQGVRSMLTCFCVVALTLSIIYYMNYDRFLQSYNGLSDMERSGWTDPNYLSCIMGMGVVSSLLQFIKSPKAGLVHKFFWIFTIIITFSAQLLIASRGALLAEIIAVPILLATTKISRKRKFLILSALVFFVCWLYSNSYFELMEYRILNDSGTGGGRSVVWEQKLSAFFESNLFNQLFGIGFVDGLKLGTGKEFGFHNDFIAMLCDYGYIGLVLFISCLLYPIFKTTKSLRYEVVALVAYLAVVCFSLEPISSGRLPYFGFYFLILLYSKNVNFGLQTLINK